MSQATVRWLVFIFLGGFTAFRLYYIQAIPLSEDEAYYWQWSRHLAWGYYDGGPVVAWMIRLGTWLWGSTELGVRFTAVLLGLGLSLVLYGFCRSIFKNELLGLLLVLAANGTVFFTAASIIQTYDTSQAFFWGLSVYSVALAVFNGRSWAWYLGGAACGLAMLSKYSSLLLPLLILGFLLVHKGQRHWLGRPQPWLAALLALLIFAPNLYWNATHHWAAFGHTVGLMRHDWNFTTFEFLAGQAGLLGPVFFGLMAAALFAAWRLARQGDDIPAYLLWVSMPVLLLFLLISMKTRVQPNWAAPGYIGAMLAAAYAIRVKMANGKAWRGWLAAGLISGYLFVALAYLHVPLLKVLDLPADQDPTNKIYGWPQLGREVARELESWPGETKPFLFGLRYQTASLAAFYTPGQPRVWGLFQPGARLNSFAFWGDPCELKGKDGLGVVIGRPALQAMFREVEILRNIELKGPTGKVLHRLNLVRGRRFRGCDSRPVKYRQGDCCSPDSPGGVRSQAKE
jgi:4-amino-4-deoxy-L-arabinose transferase-like glycosyltransferase